MASGVREGDGDARRAVMVSVVTQAMSQAVGMIAVVVSSITEDKKPS